MSLSRKNKSILTAIFIGIIGLLFLVTKIVYAPHEKTVNMEAIYKGKASDFISSVRTDSSITNGVIIELSGEVTSVLDSSATIDNNIFCQFSVQPLVLKVWTSILVKGRYIGYDDLLEEVKLDNCILKK